MKLWAIFALQGSKTISELNVNQEQWRGGRGGGGGAGEEAGNLQLVNEFKDSSNSGISIAIQITLFHLIALFQIVFFREVSFFTRRGGGGGLLEIGGGIRYFV